MLALTGYQSCCTRCDGLVGSQRAHAVFDAVLLARSEQRGWDGSSLTGRKRQCEADGFGTTVTHIELPTVCFFVYNVVTFLLRT